MRTERRAIAADLPITPSGAIDEEDLRAALTEFDGLWGQLLRTERIRLLALLIEKVSFHAAEEEIQITFRPGGIREAADTRRATV